MVKWAKNEALVSRSLYKIFALVKSGINNNFELMKKTNKSKDDVYHYLASLSAIGLIVVKRDKKDRRKILFYVNENGLKKHEKNILNKPLTLREYFLFERIKEAKK